MDPEESNVIIMASPETEVEEKKCNSAVEDPMPQVDVTRLRGKLYGRSKQEVLLNDAYRRLSSFRKTTQSNGELVLISGAAGTGKTYLARTLREQVDGDGGFFIAGKFDQLQSPEAYAPLVAAFTELANMVVAKGEELRASMKRAIEQKVEGEGRILTDMIPALEQIIGRQDEVAVLQGSEALFRFKTVFLKFIQAICSQGVPIVLLLDDLQWADCGSLYLIHELIADVDSQGIVYVGTCRDNVSTECELSAMLRKMESQRVRITNIGVSNLREESVNDMISDLLQLERVQCLPLAALVCEQTDGNVFFSIEYIQYLVSEQLVYLDNDKRRWDWRETEIRNSESWKQHRNVVELINSGISRLPHHVQQMLKVASCVGAQFNKTTLERALVVNWRDALTLSLDKGLVVNDSHHGSFKFAHDRIQQAAYALIPENEKGMFHLEIGRKLWKNLTKEELKHYIFIVLSQLKRSSQLLRDDERSGVASLCLMAGEIAMKSSAFRTAAEYLEFGIDLLGSKKWTNHYELTLALCNMGAEAEFVTGNFETMDKLTDEVFDNALCFRDKLRAYASRVYSLGVRNESHVAIDTGFDVLRKLGEPFPSQAPMTYVVKEILKTKWMLRGKSVDGLKRLAPMQDPDKIAAMQILSLIYVNTYLVRPEFLAPVALRMLQLTLRFGMCAVSSVAFSAYGMILAGVLNEKDLGFRYGQLALSIMDSFKARQWVPRVYAALYGCIDHWRRPIHLSLEPLKRAHKVGIETGDMEFSMLCEYLYCIYSFAVGKPLQELEEEVRANSAVMQAHKLESSLTLALPLLQFILNLVGKSEDPLVLTGEVLDQDEAIRNAVGKKLSTSYVALHQQRLMLACIFGDFILAKEMANECLDMEKVCVGSYSIADVFCFAGLAFLAGVQGAKYKKKDIRAARRCIKKMKGWAKLSPENFLANQCFLEAEYAALLGNHDRATAKYSCATSLLEAQGYLMLHVVACERAGRYKLRRGDNPLACRYFNQAYLSCVKWGAHAKTKQLKDAMRINPGLSQCARTLPLPFT